MHNIFKDVSAIARLHSRFKLMYMLLLSDEQLQVFKLLHQFLISRHYESRRTTDELGSRQRDLSISSVTKWANGHWHVVIRIQLQLITAWWQQWWNRINSSFRFVAEWLVVEATALLSTEECSLACLVTLKVDRSLWRDLNTSVIRRDVSEPPSGNEGYIRNRDIFQGQHFFYSLSLCTL